MSAGLLDAVHRVAGCDTALDREVVAELGLPAGGGDHRRVLAVLAFLRASG